MPALRMSLFTLITALTVLVIHVKCILVSIRTNTAFVKQEILRIAVITLQQAVIQSHRVTLLQVLLRQALLLPAFHRQTVTPRTQVRHLAK